MGRKSKKPEGSRIASMIDFQVLEGCPLEIVTDAFQEIKKQYNVTKIVILRDSKEDSLEDAQQLSQAVSVAIGQDIPIEDYPESGILSSDNMRCLTFLANRTVQSYRNETQVHLSPFDNGKYYEQFKKGGFEVCVSNSLSQVIKNVGRHVDRLKKWAGPSVD